MHFDSGASAGGGLGTPSTGPTAAVSARPWMRLAGLRARATRALTLLISTMAVAAMAGCAAHNQSPLPPASTPPNQVVTAPPSVPLPTAPALPPPQTSVEPAPFAIAAGPDGNL